MKYSIGDRVIVKSSGEKGIVALASVERYRVYILGQSIWFTFYDHDMQTDLTAIEKPFGLLSREVQDELKAMDNGENMQYWGGSSLRWIYAPNAIWDGGTTYRLDPNWKEEEVKETKCESDGQIYTSYPPQYRCKHCLRWWFCSEPTPVCGSNVKEMTVKEMTVADIEKLVGGKVKIVKER